MNRVTYIVLLLISIKDFSIDTMLYAADVHSVNTTINVLLDHSLEDSSDSTTICEMTTLDIPETAFLFLNCIIENNTIIPEFITLITSPPPRA